MGSADPRSSETRFENTEICAVPQASIARSETYVAHGVGVEPKSPYASDDALAQELWRYYVTVE